MIGSAARADLRLISSIPGRQRWQAPFIKGRFRLAAAVEAAIRGEVPFLRARANPTTGRILLEWDPASSLGGVRGVLSRALFTEPLSEMAWNALQADARSGELVGKLAVGALKLSLVFANRLVFGTFLGGPLGTPVAILSVAGTLFTGFGFIRAAFRTLTGETPVTTGTLIGTATLSSIALRESVTALAVIWLLNLGEYLESVILRRSRAAIRDLLSADDGEIWVLINGVAIATPPDRVRPGQIAVVRSGQRIPVDGIIESGAATISEAAMTGESVPVMRSAGDRVFAGTLALAGTVHIRITHAGSETAVAKLIERVEMAHSLRPEIQSVGDSFARKVVPASFVSAAAVLALTGNPRRALTMLLVACPCAAGLATPTAVSASIGNSARRGILIKGGRHLESLADVKTIGFDKTGTLTNSEPEVERVTPLAEDYSPARILKLAARAEVHSQHPLALAVLNRAGRVDASGDFELLAGAGVRCCWDHEEVLVGNIRLMGRFEIPIPRNVPEPHINESVMYVAHDRRIVGVIGVSTTVRPEARGAIRRLRQSGIARIVMLTGDSPEVAKHVAGAVGMTEWHARMLPEDKFDAIRRLRANGAIAMIGDGVNDAPALALADVGIAMGTAGSDVAIETADIALAGDDLHHIVDALDISRRTMSVVRQNYSLSVGVNSVGLAAAAAGRLNPILAAVLHNLSTVLVVLNSYRLIHYAPGGRAVAAPARRVTGQQEEHRCCGDRCAGDTTA